MNLGELADLTVANDNDLSMDVNVLPAIIQLACSCLK